VKPIILRILPGGLLVLAATVLLRSAALRDTAVAMAPALPWTVFIGGMLLGWRFHRTRMVLALLVLALADRALLGFAAGGAVTAGAGRVIFTAVALLLPVNLAAIAWLPERGLLSPRGRRDLAVLGAEVAAVALLCGPSLAPVAGLLGARLVDAPLEAATGVPQLAILAFLVALTVVSARFARTQAAVDGGLVWALVAAFLALTAGRGGTASTLYLATAGLVLIVCIIEMSHGMAYLDDLTGLPGRRALNEALPGLGDRYTVAMVDIDHFKRFNDTYGHDVGDELLRMVGARLARIGGGGRAYRYGGEEFAVLFPGRDLEEAVPHLEAMREGVQQTGFVVRQQERRGQRATDGRAGRVSVTVSVGAAEADRRPTTPEVVLKAADTALYRAKRAGRNRLATA
jgi:diguanylate cyclase (GGDEF)-like protein